MVDNLRNTIRVTHVLYVGNFRSKERNLKHTIHMLGNLHTTRWVTHVLQVDNFYVREKETRNTPFIW